MLRRATGDDDLAEAILRDYRTAPLSERELAMLDYAVQLTIDATKITPETHKELRNAGFDDTAILQITLIASWFNYINRVADSLGIGR
ncbi:MAG: carboxymuconolactone decarboxylase family protein [Pyrinomonadaceae bacterium]